MESVLRWFDLPHTAMFISRIEEKLRRHPHVTYTVKQGCLRIPAQSPTGFEVWITERPESLTVGFEGWHEEFRDGNAALNCFAFGLSTACRLRVFSRGGMDYKWQMLSLQNGEWVPDSETSLLFIPFWRKRRERVLSNELFNGQTPSAEAGAEADLEGE